MIYIHEGYIVSNHKLKKKKTKQQKKTIFSSSRCLISSVNNGPMVAARPLAGKVNVFKCCSAFSENIVFLYINMNKY